MDKKKHLDKLIYPTFIFVIAIVCAALILLELWVNISALLPSIKVDMIDGIVSAIEELFQQVIRFIQSIMGTGNSAGISPAAHFSTALLFVETLHARKQ
jgi:hypothetical protein